MSDKRIIKKYPNRRLYDTRKSRYITLEDVKKLVLDGEEFMVRDVKSEEDLTRSILLQIITEREHSNAPLFSTDSLSHIIRLYGDSIQSAAADFLQKSIDLLVTQQSELHKHLHSVVTANPIAAMTAITEKNLQMWKQMQENFLEASTNSTAGNKDKKPD